MSQQLLISLDGLTDNQLIDSHQTASILGIKHSTLSVWRSTGRYGIRFIKTGRLVRYRVADIRAFIDSRSRTQSDYV